MDPLQRHIQADIGRPPRRVGSLKSSVIEKPPIGRPKLTRMTSDSVSKGIEQGRFDKRSFSYSEDYNKNLNRRSLLNSHENIQLENSKSNNDNSLTQKDTSSSLNSRKIRSLSVERKTDMVTNENDTVNKAYANTSTSEKSTSDNEKLSLRKVRNKSVERMSVEKYKNDDKSSDKVNSIKGVKKENNVSISSDNGYLFSKKLNKSKEDKQNDLKVKKYDMSNRERNGIYNNGDSDYSSILSASEVSPEKSSIRRQYSKSLEKPFNEKHKESVTDGLTKSVVSCVDVQKKIVSPEKEMKSLVGNTNPDVKIMRKGSRDSVHYADAYSLDSEELIKPSKTACKGDMKSTETLCSKKSDEHDVGSSTDYKKKNIDVSYLPRPITKNVLSEKKTIKTDRLSRSKDNIINNENYVESKQNDPETSTAESLGPGGLADSISVLTNTHNDRFTDHKVDSLTDPIHADTGERKFSLDSTCSFINNITSKVKTGNNQSYIYGQPLSLYSQINRDSINKFNKSYGLLNDRLEKAGGYNDYTLPRPRHMLGRTLSYSGPRLNHSYDSYRLYQMPPSSRYGSLISREPYIDYSKYVSRYTQPRSMYGNRDSISSELNFRDGISSELNCKESSDSSGYYDGMKDDVSASVATTRIPSYQRSRSENQESTSSHIRRSLSVTPEKSVLGKFLSKEKLDSEAKEKKSTKEKGTDKSNNKSKNRVRKISRFLRPDFYDTPLEESVFSKNKDKKTNNMKKEEIESNTEKCNGKDEKLKKPGLQYSEKGSKHENKMSIIEKAIRSLRERSLGRGDSACMSRESNLIKRAVSLDDCSVHHDSRLRRSSSVTPKPVSDKKQAKKVEKSFFKKKSGVKKVCEETQNSLRNVDNSVPEVKETIVVENVIRKDNPKFDNAIRRASVSCGAVSGSFGESFDGSHGSDFNVSVGDDSGVYSVKKCHSLETRSRAGRIAGLKPLDLSYPNKSMDLASHFEDDKSKTSFEIDDSTSFLSPTEDSDTWSASSDYADARDFSSPSGNTEDSVSERIRRKSFYLRFNQSKRRKPPPVPLGQYSSQRSRLPYTRSVSSDIAYLKNLPCNVSDVNKKD